MKYNDTKNGSFRTYFGNDVLSKRVIDGWIEKIGKGAFVQV
jgi:hypothetical protein